MRLKRIDPAQGEDLVTLWHMGGTSPCRGPAIKVPAGFLEVEDPTLPEGCELPDGSKLDAGAAPVCGTCGQHLGDDLGAELALSRGR